MNKRNLADIVAGSGDTEIIRNQGSLRVDISPRLPCFTFLRGIRFSGSLVAFNDIAQAQTELSYYFAHIASAGPWRTTFTYVNQTTLPVTCDTSFYSDTGTALPLTFNGASMSSVADNIAAGGLARRQTDAQPSLPSVTGWAAASCNGPVKASALFRSYNGNIALAEASVPAMASPATQFVTYADQSTGVALDFM